MTFPQDPTERQPKGDHNRRLSLGLDADEFAAAAGVTVDELRDYENTSPDRAFSPMIAERVGEALERLEAVLPNSEAAGIRQITEADVAVVHRLDPDASVEQSIRDTAYHLWESDGRPEGRDEEYWHRASAAWLGQQGLDAGFEEAVTEPDPDTLDGVVDRPTADLQSPFLKPTE